MSTDKKSYDNKLVLTRNLLKVVLTSETLSLLFANTNTYNVCLIQILSHVLTANTFWLPYKSVINLFVD